MYRNIDHSLLDEYIYIYIYTHTPQTTTSSWKLKLQCVPNQQNILWVLAFLEKLVGALVLVKIIQMGSARDFLASAFVTSLVQLESLQNFQMSNPN